MKKLLSNTILLSITLLSTAAAQAHEGHMGDVIGHFHGAEGLLLLALITVASAAVLYKK